MATPVEMPKLGNTVEECLLSRWAKGVGETVAEGELLAEIETDKATFDLTAPVSGTLLAVFFSPGDLAPVFTNICVIGAPGEDPEPFRPRASAAPLPHDRNSDIVPGRESSPSRDPERAAPAGPGVLSPRARRFAAAHGITAVPAGSGPGGRVLEDDIKRLYYTGAGPQAAPPSPASPRPMTVRERIAHRMRESLCSTAQYTLHASAPAAGLLTLRARFKAAGPEVNINHMVVWCVVKALAEVPELNAEWTGGRVVAHDAIHIGFACDTPRGLLVPVVRDCRDMPLTTLAARMYTLAARAVAGSISPDDLSGGTFTVSNLGGFGIESFTPILNPPQVAILGVNAIELKPVRRGGTVEFEDRIGLSLTLDHQAIDGAPGARFLQRLCRIVAEIEGAL